MRSLKLLPLVVVVYSLAANASAQQVGDKIVVTTDHAPLRSGNATTGTVDKGNLLVVKNVNGDWFWVIWSSGETETIKGWINRSDVIPFLQALEFFNEEVKRNPTSSAYHTRGMIWNEKGEYDIAIGDYSEAIRLDPNNKFAYNSRGNALGDKKEYEKAVSDFNEAIRLYPKFSVAYNNRGIAWRDKKEYEKAISDFNEAIRLDPKDANAYSGRGAVWGAKKEYDKSIADFNEAIRLDPKLEYIYCNRAIAWNAKGDYVKAISDYGEAIRLDPKDAGSWNSRAWLAATCPDAKYRDGNKAVDDATKACELDGWTKSNHLDTLAAAYAEAADFPNAVKWAKKSIELAPENKKGDCQSRLDLYKARKPYRREVKK
jgi:tetratricopeptide (TPR) repeat protein